MDYLNHERFHDIVALRLEGRSYREISDSLKVSPATAYRCVSAAELDTDDPDVGIPGRILEGLGNDEIERVLALSKEERSAWYQRQREVPVAYPDEAEPPPAPLSAGIQAAGSPSDGGQAAGEGWLEDESQLDLDWLITDPEIARLCEAARIPRLSPGLMEQSASRELYTLAREICSVYHGAWKDVLKQVLVDRSLHPSHVAVGAHSAAKAESDLWDRLRDTLNRASFRPEERVPYLEKCLELVGRLARKPETPAPVKAGAGKPAKEKQTT